MRYDRPHLVRLLRQLNETQGSDLLLKVPGRPALRIDGEMVRLAEEPLRPVDTKNAAMALMGLADTEIPLMHLKEHELAFGMPGVGRFRALIYRQRGSIGISVHRLAMQSPKVEELGLDPKVVQGITGLSLVCGSRERQALAAIVDHWNHKVGGHIVVLEDQIEYLHRDARAAVSHREVGIDTENWETGLCSAMRHDADLVVLGRVRDVQAAEKVLQAVEHGKRVLVSLPATSPKAALNSFIRLFGQEREKEVRSRLLQVFGASIYLGKRGVAHLVREELEASLQARRQAS
ncbi:MAG: ATPase, T2SS/T4P/T4SS family [Myxococcota bacterium]|nr:ATPase, T2SS/T4P/T4SS family [Myxococcota bacterium]